MNENLDDNEPGALNLILSEQFQARMQALMTRSPDLRSLREQLGKGSLRVVIDEGDIADARIELRGQDVTDLVAAIFNSDEGLKWLVTRLEKGSLRIYNKTKHTMGLRVERDLDIDDFGYVK